MEKNKFHTQNILIIIIAIFLILIVGTAAWLTWRSGETTLILTFDEEDDSKVIIKPYKIEKKLIPTTSYDENDPYTSKITIINGNNTDKKTVKIYYHINNIDEELKTTSFKYTIKKSTDNGNTYHDLKTGDFHSATNGANFYILEEQVPAHTTYKYKVYIWLDGGHGNQENIQGKTFKGELMALNIPIPKPSAPTLDPGMIPVVFDTSNGTQIKSIGKNDKNWYNYNNKEWANAVLVSSSNTNSTAYDLSQNNTSNNIRGASYTNEGLYFDGTNDSILMPIISVADLSSFTFEAKFKADVIDGYERNILVNWESGGAGLHISPSKKLGFQVNTTGDGYTEVTSNKIASTNAIYTISGVYENNTIKLYINGELENSKAVNGSIQNPSAGVHYMIGCNPNASNTCDGGYFKGTIHSVRMYNRALSNSEIKHNFNNKDVIKNGMIFGFDYQDGKRLEYINSSNKIIPESEILAYYVWIPRYKYRISPGSGPREIDIEFEGKDASKSNGDAIMTYRTHPAFTFGNTELDGIWVGKFETSGIDTLPTIKPDVTSLIYKNISTFANINQKFKSIAYGLSNIEIDAHMMKNSEWAAAAYLSNSMYGANREIYINNSSSFYTGRSGGNIGGNTAISSVYSNQNSSEQYNQYGFYTWDGYLLEYNTNTRGNIRDLNKVASTTGNITGVYDMSGGAWEYVLGNYNNVLGSSGFSTLPNSKYYDTYLSESEIYKGHALSETSGWYSDYLGFVNNNYQWFMRGGPYSYGALTGLFYFAPQNGSANSSIVSRSVITCG